MGSLPEVDLLKIDAEGHDFDVLRGVDPSAGHVQGVCHWVAGAGSELPKWKGILSPG